MIDRVPPQALDIERTVLATLLTNQSAIDEAMGVCKADHFYATDHRAIFEAISALYGQNQPVDVVTVDSRLEGQERAKSALVDLLDCATVANLLPHCEILRQKASMRQVIAISTRAIERAYAPDMDASEVINGLQSDVMDLDTGTDHRECTHIMPVMRDTFADIEAMARHEKIGIETGLIDLDEITTGLHPGDLTVVAGRPGMGKTALGMCMAIHIAKSGLPVVVFSLEMPKKQLVMRALCQEARISFHLLRRGKLPKRDYPKLSIAASPLSDAPLYIADAPGATPMEVMSKSRKIKRQHGNLGLILIDYIQLMHPGKRCSSREQEVSHCSRYLKAIAKELDCPVMALAQLSRAAEQRPDKRPQLSDLRESGSIEQDSDNVIGIYRDEVYKTDSEEKGVAELLVLKQRNGPVGTVEVRFEPESMLFMNLEKGSFNESEAEREDQWYQRV